MKKKKIGGKMVHYCDECWEWRKILTKATHIQEPDPFAEEINGDNTPVDLCERHYQISCDEI